MSPINDGDTFIANRSNTSYQIQAQDFMTKLQDTDLMLVNRGGVSYKATGDEIKEYLTPPVDIYQPTVIAPPDGAGVGGDVTYTPRTSDITDIDDYILDYTSGVSNVLSNPTPVGLEEYAFDGTTSLYKSAEFLIEFNPPLAYSASTDGSLGFKIQTGTSMSSGINSQNIVQVNNGIWYCLCQYGPDGNWNNMNQGSDFSYAVNSSKNVFKVTDGSAGSIFSLRFRHVNPLNITVSSTGVVGGNFSADTSNRTSVMALYCDDKLLADDTYKIITVQNDKTYNAETDAEIGVPISETFTAGQRVSGQKAAVGNAYGKLLVDASGNQMAIEPYKELDEDITDANTISYQGGDPTFVYDGTYFYAYGNQSVGNILRSTDGVNWEEKGMLPFRAGRANSAYDGIGTIMVAPQVAEGTLAITTDQGESYQTISTPAFTNNSQIYSVVSNGNGTFLVTNQQGETATTSNNGTSWTIWGTGLTGNTSTQKVCWSGSKWVAYLSGGAFHAPLNGSSWTPATTFPGTTEQAAGIASDNNGTVYTVGSYTINVSEDSGVTWKGEIAAPTGSILKDVAYSNGLWILVGKGIWTTPNILLAGPTIIYDVQPVSLENIAVSDSDYLVTGYVVNSPFRLFTITGYTVTNPFVEGMEILNSTTLTQTGPSSEELVFVGSTPASDPSDGVLTWGNATWEVSTDSSFATRMVGTKIITAGINQTLLPAERGTIVLQADTDYWARVSYNATDPAILAVTSDAVHFKTANNVYTVDEVFSIDVYSGQSTPQTINNGINYLENALIWIKNTSQTDTSHTLFDKQRDNYLNKVTTNDTTGESPVTDGITPANGNVTIKGGDLDINYSGYDYVSFSFKAAPRFFDVVKYTGNADLNQIVPHGLTTIPGCIIVKNLEDTHHWNVYHKEGDINKNGWLDTTAVFQDSVSNLDCWTPTASSFTANDGRIFPSNNENAKDYIAYFFADTPGLIKCGAYVGGGNSNVVNVDCGFGSEPAQWVMIKNKNDVGDWLIINDVNGNSNSISANYGNAMAGNSLFDFIPGGFSLRADGPNHNWNFGGHDYVYVAISKGGSTLFFDTEAFKAITDQEVIDRFGVDPYTTNLKPFGIQRLMEEPTGVTAGYALCEGSDTLCSIEDLTNVNAGLENTITEAQDTIAVIQARVAKIRSQFGLPATAEIPQAINGFFPLYTSEVESDLVSENSQSHEHDINGVTYYMPDTGVTLYHGNYDDSSSGGGY